MRDGAFRNSAAHRADRRRDDARAVDDDDFGRSRIGPAVDPQRVVLRRQAERRLVGRVRTGVDAGRTARVRRAFRSGRLPDRRHEELDRRLSAGHLPGDAVPAVGLSRARISRRRRRGCPRHGGGSWNSCDRSTPTILGRHPENSELEARITNYELAARMQTSVPEALDISQESKETQALYGLDQPDTAEYGKRCLVARRLVERGVRFVQVFLSGQPWDTHTKNAETLKASVPRPTSRARRWSLDLKRRGLLDSTRSSCGRASSAGCPFRRGPTAATTTGGPSRCGWPAADSSGATSTARPTSSATSP